METQPPTSSPTPPARPRLASSTIWLLIILLVIMVFAWYQQDRTTRTQISYDFFYRQLQAGNVAEIEFINPQQIVGRFSDLEFARRQLARSAQLRPAPQVSPSDSQTADGASSANDASKGDENPIERDKKSQAAKSEQRRRRRGVKVERRGLRMGEKRERLTSC